MSVVDEIKARLDIVQLVSNYVPLQKAGRNFRASCPFHTERTPSFYVFPERGAWRCFGACAEGGDAFTFLMKKEDIPFGEALTRLAQETGVDLPDTRRSKEKVQEEDQLAAANKIAAEFFHHLLLETPQGTEALHYLQQRGIDRQAIDEFQLGLGPAGWDTLKRRLGDFGISESVQLKAGLLVESERGGTYDRFRERITFPIQDRGGSVVGFGARSLDGSTPKYVNTPQTPLFDKSSVLYGIDKAAAHIRNTGQAVVVEGYTDVIQAHRHGFTNVVASMGTALTEKQVALLHSLANSFILALDPDTAGEQATRRSLEASWGVFRRTVLVGARGSFYQRGGTPDLSIMSLPAGVDPADLITQDPNEWQKRLVEASPLLDYLIAWETAQAASQGPAGQQAAVDKLKQFIFELDNPFEQDRYFRKLAAALGVEERTLAAAIGRPETSRRRGRRQGQSTAPEASPTPFRNANRDRLEEHTLALLLHYPELKKDIHNLAPEHFQRSENREVFTQWGQSDSIEELRMHIPSILEDHLDRLLQEGTPAATSLSPPQVLWSCIRRLEERRLRTLKAEERVLDGAAEGNFAQETDRQAALERASQLHALLAQRH